MGEAVTEELGPHPSAGLCPTRPTSVVSNTPKHSYTGASLAGSMGQQVQVSDGMYELQDGRKAPLGNQ